MRDSFSSALDRKLWLNFNRLLSWTTITKLFLNKSEVSASRYLQGGTGNNTPFRTPHDLNWSVFLFKAHAVWLSGAKNYWRGGETYDRNIPYCLWKWASWKVWTLAIPIVSPARLIYSRIPWTFSVSLSCNVKLQL